MLKLIYYVPEAALDATKHAIFSAGGGRDQNSNYSDCAWQVKGIGQFRPIDDAQPTIGKLNQLTQIEEWRVEVIVLEQVAAAVKQALIAAHPYEEVALEFVQLLDI